MDNFWASIPYEAGSKEYAEYVRDEIGGVIRCDAEWWWVDLPPTKELESE